MKKRKYIVIAVVLIILTIAISIISILPNKNKKESISNNLNISVEYKEEEENLNWKQENYEDIELKESITINKAGTYHLTGKIEDGNITVNVGDNDLVRLVLDNVYIKSNSTSCINVENAKKVIILLEEGSNNTLIDGETYSNTEEPDSTIFSKDDLVINGLGTLNVTANYLDAITSKDDLKILNATINITANDDGIKGKDYIGIKNSNILLNAKSDGIKSTNSTETDKGYILIENSNINIESEEDGLQAETTIKIIGGTFNIKTGGGNTNSSTSENWGKWNMKDRQMPMMNNNTIEQTEEISAKAIKGNTGIIIESGNFIIDSSDDSIHSNGIININGGTFEIKSGDDGIHADESIYINDGNVDIKQSYEGIEASFIEINNGNISIIASDDGINVSGGNDSSSINGRPGQNDFKESSNQSLNINGGQILIDATGDGIDINGSGYINAGKIFVNGPTNDGNGALDYSGVFEVKGGELVAVGSSGMMQSPTSNSEIYSISYVFGSAQVSEKEISLKNKEGEIVIEFTPSKQYNSIIISSEKIKEGEIYYLYIEDEKIEDITINNIVTSAGSGKSGINPGMNSGFNQGMMIEGKPEENQGFPGEKRPR